MRPSSWEALALSGRRMVLLCCSFGVVVGAVVFAATSSIFGAASPILGAVLGVAAAYTVASEPKRSLERSAIIQAREAPTLAASAAVYLQSTGSRARTALMLTTDEPRLSSLFEGARNSTLLGVDPAVALRRQELVRSDSMSAVLAAVGRAHGERLYDEGQEADMMASNSAAYEETKFPAFLAVSFFMPIMMMLLAAIGHHDDIVSVASLGLLEAVVLDIVLSFSSTERRKLAP